MIHFSFGVNNPFNNSSNWCFQDDYLEFDKRLPFTENKAVSFQVSKFAPGNIFDLTFRLSWRGEDHAGVLLSVQVLRWFVMVNLYDTRHWNYKKNDWYEPGQDLQEFDQGDE